jgi:biopolymer transport protein ExbB
MFKNTMLKAFVLSTAIGLGAITATYAQDAAAPAAAPAAAAPAAPAAAPAAGTIQNNSAPEIDTSFMAVVTGSGWLGVVIWLSLLGSSIAGVALIVDSFLTVKADKIIPDAFVNKIKEAMEQGDVVKAMQHCEENPGPLSNILASGFGNVQEGFEAIQDSIAIAADLEAEKLIQRINYLSVVGNIAPMLGLMGTVQGMIVAFATLASAGPAAAGMLAIAISQALWTTAAGLVVSVPTVAFFYFFKNRATNIILTMEALTLDQIKVMRNAEVVSE